MDNNLLMLDIEKFLNKYTRFMTKNIYITSNMYDTFLNQYKYLYDSINNNKYFSLQTKKKLEDIICNKKSLIKFHNKKYFKTALKDYQVFFDSLNLQLDDTAKMIILMDEENTYIEKLKNYADTIMGKISYLKRYKSYKEKDFLILTTSDIDKNKLLKKFNSSNLNINILTLIEYKDKYFSNYKLIDDKDKYSILLNYLINNLFLDKNKFNLFYKTFSKYIYLNKDYYEYETFRDYHNYMYKRKYLKSGLSLKKFNESEINKRKKQLRTINNDNLKEKEEVDIANFLYLNSVNYYYDYTNSNFKITICDKDYYIKYISDKERLENTYMDDTIYLSLTNKSNETILNILVYELIKRRCPLEKVSDEDIYNKLKETNIDNYFNEFISKYLIPIINYYEDKDINNINLTKDEIVEFNNIYNYYNDYLLKNNLITKNKLLNIISTDINNKKYKYLFLIGDIHINTNLPTFTIVSKYHNQDLIKDNIKLLYDYKKYIRDNQLIPIKDVYTSKEEISILTNNFIKDNLVFINKFINSKLKNIKIIEYDDKNRLHIYPNIEEKCFDIIRNLKGNTLIGFNNLKEINIVLSKNKFTRVNKNTLLTSDGINIYVDEILKINKIYDSIILPYLIKDNYHDELFIDEYKYNIKLMIYVALNRCKNNLIILVPSSKIKGLDIKN